MMRFFSLFTRKQTKPEQHEAFLKRLREFKTDSESRTSSTLAFNRRAEMAVGKSAFSDLTPEILAGDIRAVNAMEEKREQQLEEFNSHGG